MKKKFNLRNYFERVEEEHPVFTNLLLNVFGGLIVLAIQYCKYIYEFVVSLFR